MQITDKIMADVINTMVIVCDTREQKNQHIKEYFDNKEINYVTERLESGDYSVTFPKYPQLKLDFSILVERKNSLDEIAGNFTKGRPRFVAEFERTGESKIHIVIENATWKKLFAGSYRSQLPPQSMLAGIMTWHNRYNSPVWFCNKDESGIIIYNIIKYFIMEKLKNIKKTVDK